MTADEQEKSVSQPATPTRRLRVAHVVVQPILVWDDGSELTPGPEVGAVQLPLSQLAGLVERMPDELAELERGARAAAQ